MRRVAAQDGSASVVMAAGMLVVLVLVLGITDLGRVLAARAEARAAADAAALAAAQELALSTGADPQALAADYAAANDAELISCVCVPGTLEAVVETQVSIDGLWLLPGPRTLIQRARAVVDIPGSP